MDQYSSLSTQVLLFAARRVTPANDCWKWTATEVGSWVFSSKTKEWERFEGGRVTLSMDEEAFRSDLIEHCESYGLTTRQINQMRS